MSRNDRYAEVEILRGKSFIIDGVWNIKPFPYKSGRYCEGFHDHKTIERAINFAIDNGCKVVRVDGVMI